MPNKRQRQAIKTLLATDLAIERREVLQELDDEYEAAEALVWSSPIRDLALYLDSAGDVTGFAYRNDKRQWFGVTNRDRSPGQRNEATAKEWVEENA